ncbi:MAG: alpha/beta hydrolase [bacterium]|nr:alpha/beta hydrolase [bacterium]
MMKAPRIALLAASILVAALPAHASDASPRVRFGVADLGNGVRLHYASEGSGAPIVFLHGSLSDMSYWKQTVDAFSAHYTAIAYSRRYNLPNHNRAIAGYSALTDADDLAAFVRTQHLGKIVLVGHSYGALDALFFAVRHPEMLRALVLVEPPAISLLEQLPAARAAEGRAMYRDIQRRMVRPMQDAFRSGDRERGVATFIDYVFDDPHRWERWSQEDRDATLRDAHEWDVMLARGTLFPPLSAQAVRSIAAPTLIVSGAQTYPFLHLIDDDLAESIPNAEYLVVPEVGHQVWLERPRTCEEITEHFLARALASRS